MAPGTMEIPTEEQSRCIGDLEVDAKSIAACFRIFFLDYNPLIFVFDREPDPAECFQQSDFLFWTVVAVGARKYSEDPTLLFSLAPNLLPMLGSAVIARKDPINTMKALAIHCCWPLPHNSMWVDSSPILAGGLSHYALISGLHTSGSLQDFSRTVTVENDSVSRDRVWAICITVCQSVCMTAGIPLPLIPTHRTNLLNEELAFDVQLYSLQAKAVAHLEEARTTQSSLIWNVVEHYRNELINLDSRCPSNIRRFFLNAAKVQLTTFGFLDLSQLTVERLREMHFFACSSLETLQNHQNEPTKTDTAPIFVGHLGMVCAFTILKIHRSHWINHIDVGRGKRAYFFGIEVQKRLSIQSGDTFSRAATILMQLWTSKKIFRKPDGTVDSLSLQCVQRQGMNVVFSCFWWWRWEFNAQSFPYENCVGISTAKRQEDPTLQHHSPWSQEGIMSGRGDLVTATASAMDEGRDTGDVELPDAADFNFNYEWLTIQDFLYSDSLFT